ncbi:alpha-mannosidase [Cyberlindnera jadinii NRRL Y-1542]|uniref:Alpha-mannosidase n=1 Tax=Cyberlindnera jadinii (strain ATCC 18201 / CBS 1600 / BCRC 20928 / JCM 3617 / NBRC 0987 / NRRL Y-1542) TaxID=983966 RepID=A0A1E4S3Y8_CYBJN|nr:alpha-mannosidase [Cyberlindnera jadinii NRRL Y-1542]ODV74122.1 alpha-mannosidase [Cyberlindnera jadinii NRRL Y-1542]
MCKLALAGNPGQGYQAINNDPVAKQIDHIYQDRLRQFMDEGQYRDLNLPKFYDVDRVAQGSKDAKEGEGFVDLSVHEIPDVKKRPLFKDVINKDTEFRPAHKGDSFGPSWKTFWFKLKLRIPDKWLSEEQIWFQWDCGNEGLIYTKNGTPLQAFTGGDRNDFIIPKRYYTSKKFTLYLEMSCNGMFGVGMGSDIAPPDPNRYFTLRTADLVLPNLEARALKIDYWIISDAARELSGESWQKYKARQVATDIIEAFDPNDVKSIKKCRDIAATFIGKHVDSALVYDDIAPNGNKIDVYGIGNCHIDTAWLWPFGETRRKVVRSWTTQMELMDRYPEYRFVASQAQQYKWLEQDHPDVFERLAGKVKDKQFIPIGGSWVEHDTNIPNGESLIRQFLFGQRFYESHFGQRCTTFWLPDTFGYSSQIPQLCRLAGLDRFLTQKLSWNNINNFPNTTFNWAALDGSQVLTHMPPANTYTADANFGDVKRSLVQHKNLSYDQAGLLCFGKGDGGGGPLPEMLDRLRRCRGLSNTVGQLPTVHLGKSVDDFYDEILERTDNGKKLVSWVGELYFEFHRGTYTTQALVKKLMRRSEGILHDLEYFATIASILKPDEYKYPNKILKALWEDVLLCQFHDVLPGSCIEMVYKDDVHPMLKNVYLKANELIDEALSVLEGSSFNAQYKFVSTYQWKPRGVISVPKAFTKEVSHVEYQASEEHDYIFLGKSSVSSSPLKSGLKYPSKVSETKDGDFVLENGKLRVTIDHGGVITSLYDIVNAREVLDLTTGKNHRGANQYVLFDDTPLNWQAWDTEVFSLDTYKYVEKGTVEINETGPLVSSVSVNYKIGDKSHLKTVISLEGLDSIRSPSAVKFHCDVDWHESRKFLKVEFPVDIHSDFASYETQFGITKRPTHYNTSWDVAKFEVCHHKFADLSEHNYGVSVLNDSKYGFSSHGNLMRLSLLRSPKQPDANADMGHHEFEYALYPHAGPLDNTTVELAYRFNSKLHLLKVPLSKSFENFITFEGDKNIVLSHIKRAEDDKDVSLGDLPVKKNRQDGKAVIVRLYDSLGGRSKGAIKTTGPLVAAYKVNILEDKLEKLSFKEVFPESLSYKKVEVELRAFEVASYKLVFASN